LTLLDLEIDNLMRALRTLAVKEYEKCALSSLTNSASRELRESDGAFFESANSDETNVLLEDRLGAKLEVLSSRERELLELRLSHMTTHRVSATEAHRSFDGQSLFVSHRTKVAQADVNASGGSG
jgi:hypothetical protein